MTALPTQSVFNTVHDPDYDVLQKQIAIDGDTLKKSTRRIPASANGSGSIATPINGKTTEFLFGIGGNARARLDTTRLNIGLKIHSASATAATAVNVAPPWNMICKMINQLTLTFNGNSPAVYNKANNLFKADFMARLIHNYSLEALNKRDDMLFTPVDGDKSYLHYLADSTSYDTANFMGATAPTAYKANTTAIQAGTSSAAYFSSWIPNRASGWGGAEERMKRYVTGPFGYADSDDRTHYLSIPFADLFPKIRGIPRNLKSIGLSIQWNECGAVNTTTSWLESIGSDSAGFVSIVDCNITLDEYILSTAQATETLNDRLQNEADIISFYDVDVQKFVWTGADHIKTNVKNMESMMLLQFADEVNAYTPGTATDYYRSPGQLLFGNGCSAGTGQWRVRTDDEEDSASGALTVYPTTLQIEYGDLQYPNNPIKLENSGHFDASELYYEYLKATGRVSDRAHDAMIGRYLFQSTMPFAYLKPFSNNAAKLSDAKDLIVKMPLSGTQIANSHQGDFYLCVFVLKVIRLASDGSMSVLQ